MKTIAIISSQAFSLINFRGTLIKALHNRNVRIYALAPDYSHESREHVTTLGATPVDFQLTRTGLNPLLDLRDFCRLIFILRRLQPDITLTYFIKPVIFGTLAAWIVKVPRRVAMIEGLGYVFTASGGEPSWARKILRTAVSWLYRVALSTAHSVVFLNRDDIAEFVQAGLVVENKVYLLGGIGVDLDLWRIAPVSTVTTTFIMTARLLREKGVLEYAASARQVKALHPETRFILLGGLDPNPGSLTQLEVQVWADEGLLEWPGHVDVGPWLAQASVFVLPSYREGVPRSTQEAMAMGRAVITTDVPGCRETVIDGVNGYLVAARDVNGLAEAMLAFVENPSRAEIMGRESRVMAEKKFDVHKVNAQLLRILGVE